MVRGRAFDCGEIAIVTFMQAKTYNKPLALLPASLVGRFQQNALHYNAERGALTPQDLNGKRIGVGSYTTTTGVWVRGVLQHEYGVDPAGVTWVVTGDAHLAEFTDPPNVQKAGAGKKLDQMLLDGEIDALISPVAPQDPRVKSLIPDAQAAGQAWGQKNGTVQINHMFAVDTDLLAQRPDVVKEIYRMLLEARQSAGPSGGAVDMLPFGDAARPGVNLMGQYAQEQKIVPKRYTADELFGETAKAIG
jgi:4,5-dihydroxyphthalate decarboxylase